jgi:rSAM/selenodomain-associated transferase 1
VPGPLPRLLLFARAPIAGRVKTRLTPALGAGGAAALYRAFLEDAARVYRSGRWDSVLCAEGDPLEPALAEIFPREWRRCRQAEGDLGQRLADAFDREFRGGASVCAAVGSDHPALPAARLEELFAALADGSHAALVPAEDGGYCAIGLRAEVAPRTVFDGIAWSTGEVLRQTIRRLDASGLRYRLLEPGYDVDRPEDLERLRRDLESRDPAADDYPAATARILALLGTISARPA